MTKIKIPFIKTKAKKYSGSDKPANAEGLELEISTTFKFSEVWEKVSPDTIPSRMRLSFIDGAETEIFNELLDDDKVSFELSFEKEKVDFYAIGVEYGDKDDTKITIDCWPPNDSKDINDGGALEIYFEPKFAGVVKIDYVGGKEPNDNQNNNKEEIDKLQTKIKELEEKLRQKPNSSTDQNDLKKIEELKNEKRDKEITSLKNQIKILEDKIKNTPDSDKNKQRYNLEIANLKTQLQEKENHQPTQPSKKDKFPTGLVVGGGIVIFLLLIAVIFFWQRSRRR